MTLKFDGLFVEFNILHTPQAVHDTHSLSFYISIINRRSI